MNAPGTRYPILYRGYLRTLNISEEFAHTVNLANWGHVLTSLILLDPTMRDDIYNHPYWEKSLALSKDKNVNLRAKAVPFPELFNLTEEEAKDLFAPRGKSFYDTPAFLVFYTHDKDLWCSRAGNFFLSKMR
jgi:hypothetical protein